MNNRNSLDTIQERIDWVVHNRRISKAEFARRIGVKPQQMSRWVNDPKYPPGRDSIRRIAQEGGVDPAWLEYGGPTPRPTPDDGRDDLYAQLGEIIRNTDTDALTKQALLLDLALVFRSDALRMAEQNAANRQKEVAAEREFARKRFEAAAADPQAAVDAAAQTPAPRRGGTAEGARQPERRAG